MLKLILERIRETLPGTRIIPAPCAFRGNTVVYRYYSSASVGRRTSARLELRFVSDTLAGAMAMYSDVRGAIISDSDLDRVGEGVRAVHIQDIPEGSSSGYIRKSGMFFIKAGFAVTGY